jgi:ceramide glucosyltransferase
MSARELWDHELRWARTVKTVDPLGYAGSIITYPLAWAVIGTLLGLGAATPWPAIVLGVIAIVGRIALLRQVEQSFALPPQTYWLLPLRDLLSFVVFLASFLGRGVSWQGHRYRIMPDGTLVPYWRSPKP